MTVEDGQTYFDSVSKYSMKLRNDCIYEKPREWAARLTALDGEKIGLIPLTPGMTVWTSQWKVAHGRALQPIAKESQVVRIWFWAIGEKHMLIKLVVLTKKEILSAYVEGTKDSYSRYFSNFVRMSMTISQCSFPPFSLGLESVHQSRYLSELLEPSSSFAAILVNFSSKCINSACMKSKFWMLRFPNFRRIASSSCWLIRETI